MRKRKLYSKERGKYGAGRQTKPKYIGVSKELKDELLLFKQAYSVCLSREKDDDGNPKPVLVSYEQMFRRWMDHVGRIDKDVKEYVEQIKAGGGTNPSVTSNPVNPRKKEVWEIKYFFRRGDEELDAHLGDKAPFYANVIEDGKTTRMGFKKMLAAGWTLLDEAGQEIDDIDEAWSINRTIKQHHVDHKEKNQA